MTTTIQQALWIIGTIAVALMSSVGADLLVESTSTRVIVAHALITAGVSVGALLAKFPQRIWSDSERADKVGPAA